MTNGWDMMRWFHLQKDLLSTFYPRAFGTNELMKTKWFDEWWSGFVHVSTCLECSMFSVPLKVEDVKFKASIFLEVLKPPPTYQLAYDYNWSEIEGNSEDCIFWTKWKALLNSWRSFLFFFSKGILDEYNLSNILFMSCTLRPSYWLMIFCYTGDRGKLSIQHSAMLAPLEKWNMILVFNTVAVSRDSQTSKRNSSGNDFHAC